LRKSPRSSFKNVYELDLEHPIVNPLVRTHGISRILAAKPGDLVSEVDNEFISLSLIGDFLEGG
jgi:hypothetical protein